MPSTDHLLAFAVVSLVFVAIPGPSVLFTISRALTLGRRPALLTVVGNAAGKVDPKERRVSLCDGRDIA